MRSAVLARKSTATPAAEAKVSKPGGLRIGEPNDAFEQEADRVADEVMAGGQGKLNWSFSKVQIGDPLQRKCACGGSATECEECKQKQVQRRAIHASGPSTAPPIVDEVLHSPGQPLDAATRAFFEPRFGHNLGGVRVHADARAAESAQAVNALAYTVGADVVFGARQYIPKTAAGRRLIAHELVHTLQQSGTPAPVAAVSTNRRDDTPESPASHAVEGFVAGRRPSVASGPARVLSRQDKGPSTDTPEEEEEKRKKKELLESVKSTEVGRPIPGAQYTWGWGGAETKNVSQECKVTGLERPQFLTLFKSLPAPTNPRPRRQKPHDAEEALGVTQLHGKVVAPEIAASAVPGGFKLKPTHAEMPSVYSAFTKENEYIEGTRQCLEPSCAFARRGTSKFPLHWKITKEGAALLKKGEEEHCNDYKAAFELTLAIYASVINNLAAAERVYSSEKQAVDEAISYVKVPPDAMEDKFVAMAQKTELRDTKGWHTTNDNLPPHDRHSQSCSLDNGCKSVEIIDEKSLPEVANDHSSAEILTPSVSAAASAPVKSGGSAPVHIQRKIEESNVAVTIGDPESPPERDLIADNLDSGEPLTIQQKELELPAGQPEKH